jgi:outer membrane receptor protein involved in Fe transport
MKLAAVLAAALAGVSSQALAAAATPPIDLSAVQVTAPTPLYDPAALKVVAAPVQTLSADQIDRSRALDLSAALNRSLGSVYINDVQNNPLQPDLNYRGFTASPLLGTPQGLSLYMDGVRLNQPFGEAVSWDLIPKAAIADVTLAPGSDPLFGLNTLGGALSIRTKDGRTAPGAAVQLGYGSYDRWQAEAELGGHADNGLHWYLTANRFEDDGWRDFSPSKATQGFGKLGWGDGRTEIALSGALAYTDLTGNGLQEQRFLERDRSSVYTKPDNTKNQSSLLNLTASHKLTDALSLSGNAYYREIDTKTLNGDINDETLTESVYQPSAAERTALTAAGYRGFPLAGETAANTPFPSWRCIANALLNSEPGEKCNGLLNRSRTEQSEAGLSGQLTLNAPLGGRKNSLIAGGAYSASRAHFSQSSQFGFLTPERGVVGVSGPGAFADGTQDSENAFDARVNLRSRTRVFSLYASDTLALAPGLNLTVSARYNRSTVKNRDAVTPSGSGSLTADHKFDRLNPSVGLTYEVGPGLTAYAGYNEGARAPSAIELGCSDPDNPCRLPNALAGDPPLKQVVTKTVEGGLRGLVGKTRWRAGVFSADNHDDIIFVVDGVSSFGYFKNFGRTRRQGIELGFDSRIGRVSFGGDYTLLEATYRTAEQVNGTGNSSNDVGPGFEGSIDINPGDRIPLIPRHIVKARASWAATSRLDIDADMFAASGVYARGNDNNLHQPDGVFSIGPGKTKGYAVFNLGGAYRLGAGLKLFVQVSNLFDKRYASAAQLGNTGFNSAGNFIARPFAGPIVDGERPALGATFYGPGAPRIVWGGVRYQF